MTGWPLFTLLDKEIVTSFKLVIDQKGTQGWGYFLEMQELC